MASGADGRSLLAGVPGSHLRYQTEAERDVLIELPHDSMPGNQNGPDCVLERQDNLPGGRSKEFARMDVHGGTAQYREDDPREEKVDEPFRWRLSPNIREVYPLRCNSITIAGGRCSRPEAWVVWFQL